MRLHYWQMKGMEIIKEMDCRYVGNVHEVGNRSNFLIQTWGNFKGKCTRNVLKHHHHLKIVLIFLNKK
jgi:hypothetical protein